MSSSFPIMSLSKNVIFCWTQSRAFTSCSAPGRETSAPYNYWKQTPFPHLPSLWKHMHRVLKVPKVKLSIVVNVFFSPAVVVVQSRLTFQSSTWQELGLARSENTHYVAARSESLCLICQSFQLFRDVTLFNGPVSLILHLAKKSRWFFLPPTPV